MKIKVGQFVRYIDGVIYEVENERYVLDDVYEDLYNGHITKVADTPQELVMVGDIVEILKRRINIDYHDFNRNVKLEVMNKSLDAYIGFGSDNDFHINDIVAIYTPNAEKTQYTLQWRKEQ